MLNKHLVLAVLSFTANITIAATAVVDGVEWTYVAIDSCSCKLYKGTKSPVVTSSISGSLKVPGEIAGLVVKEIGDWAFYKCDNVTNVSMPDTIQSIGDSAFAYCSSITSIEFPSQLQTIAQSAFANCANLRSVVIPEGVNKIDDFAFSFCPSLGSIKLPSNLAYVSAYIFYECDTLERLEIPKSVKKIGSHACYGCDGLAEVLLPEGLEEIGVDAFSRCSALTSVSIPSTVGTLGNFAFSFCDSLQSVYVPEHVKVIPKETFAQCGQLANVQLAEGVESIGDGAFAGCNTLRRLALPSSCTNQIDFSRFPCNLSVDVSPANVKFSSENGAVYSRDKTVLYFVPRCVSTNEYAMNSCVLSIAPGALMDCRGIVSLRLPKGLKSIGDESFVRCYALTNVVLGENVNSIGNNAFQYCSALKSVYMPTGVVSVGAYAFGQCVELEVIELSSSVCEIKEGTFESCSALSHITIPNSVTAIGVKAFNACAGMKEIAIGSSVASIDYWAFMNCNGLESVSLPQCLKEIGSRAFYGCQNLKTIYFHGNAPSAVKKSFDGLSTHCCGVISRESTGWNVEIPGMWNGLFLRYEDSVLISFDMNYVGCSVSNVWMTVGDSLELIPTREGYNFDGWYSDAEGGSRLLTADIGQSLYAHWSEQSVELSESVTGGRKIAVNPSWVRNLDSNFGEGRAALFNQLYGNDLSAALLKVSRKRDSQGGTMYVWQDFVAGTDPTDSNSIFKVTIDLVGGMPILKWTPDLNTNSYQRIYTIYGKTNITDSIWHTPTNEMSRFFKVMVDMP